MSTLLSSWHLLRCPPLTGSGPWSVISPAAFNYVFAERKAIFLTIIGCLLKRHGNEDVMTQLLKQGNSVIWEKEQRPCTKKILPFPLVTWNMCIIARVLRQKQQMVPLLFSTAERLVFLGMWMDTANANCYQGVFVKNNCPKRERKCSIGGKYLMFGAMQDITWAEECTFSFLLGVLLD